MRLNKSIFLESFAATVKSSRNFHHYTISDLADLAGIHRNSLSAIENCTHDVSSLTSARLCLALNIQHIELSRDSTIELYPAILASRKQIPPRMPRDAYIVEKIGNAICARRQICGLTQQELAHAAGVHKNTVWSIEHGLSIPSNYNLFSIYFSLGVTVVQADVLNILLR